MQASAPLACMVEIVRKRTLMNRMDRLFGLVVLLQRRKRLRAEDLASEFGVSPCTIYRDTVSL